MKKEEIDFLSSELNYFQKLSEERFSHFMQVFYFWTAIVTAPITAGLILNQGAFTSNAAFPFFLFLIAILGWFLSAKMFDIRCSQLGYINDLNYIRRRFYIGLHKDFQTSYIIPQFDKNLMAKDLRDAAKHDFGIWMAITMSILDGVYFGVGLYLLLGQDIISFVFSFLIASAFSLCGIIIYYHFVDKRVPSNLYVKPRKDPE
jgi:hypothetical protein